MGAVDHERIVPLYSAQTLDGFATYPDGDSVPRGVETKRIPRTVENAWYDVSSQEAYEDGHSYSGNFGSKHEMQVVGRADVDLATLRTAALAVRALYYGDALTPEQVEAARHFGDTAITAAVSAFEDKWGPAAALVGRDYVWFGGSCPS